MPPASYSRAQIRLHWIVFALVALQYILHEGMVEAWDALRETGAAEGGPLVGAHIAGGLAVLALVIWRLWLRRTRGVPPPVAPAGTLATRIAGLAHGALYALLVAMVLTGGMAWFGGIEAAANAHSVLRIALLALIALHAGAALWHQFVRRDGVMARMR
ncbi:MAG: cytochrome B [Alphaproteobacteria bacterium]|nr:cytochrome B [Alphaproteobacteria bacterium]